MYEKIPSIDALVNTPLLAQCRGEARVREGGVTARTAPGSAIVGSAMLDGVQHPPDGRDPRPFIGIDGYDSSNATHEIRRSGAAARG